MKNLYLLDAYALIFRAYYAFIKNPRINSKGFNTSAILGFFNTLEGVIKSQRPSHLAVVFDAPVATFRHKMFAEYKGTRPPTPEEIKKSVPIIKDIIKSYNIPVYMVPGYEADDIIGTLAKKGEEAGFDVFMMTPDKDFCQLVSEKINIFKPKRSGNDAEIWGIKEVQNEYSVEKPEQVIDVLSLWGDQSDNVQGATGIGEKTSKKLIAKYKNIEGIYANFKDFKGKQKINLEEFRSRYEFVRKLITIDVNVPIEFNEKELKTKPINKKELHDWFENLELRMLTQRVFQQPKTVIVQGELFPREVVEKAPETKHETIETVEHDYQLVDTPEKISALVELLLQQKEVCFDTETTGLNIHIAKLVGVAFSFEAHKGYYIPVSDDFDEAALLLAPLKQFFENTEICKIGQNIKFDIIMLHYYGIETCGQLFDTMVAHYLIEPELRHNLDFLSEVYLSYKPVSIEKLIGAKGKRQRTMRDVPLETAKEYACEDADITLQLKNKLLPELEKNELVNLFYDIEMPLIPVLVSMETAGISLNTESLAVFSIELKTQIRDLENEIQTLAKFEFNVSSPKQLGEVLFERMKIISNPKRTKTKQYSTSEPELQKIKDKHEIVGKILNFRSLKKLLTTYVDALPLLVNPKSKKIHTSFNQAIVATGRLSSNEPNLQNIPIRDKNGKEMRRAFIPSEPDNVLIAADYSQIELRLMAHLSEDKVMVSALSGEKDIHTETAAKIFDVSTNEVTREMRSQAKSANFGIIYGISSFGLAQNLGIKRSEAKQLIDSYFAMYPDVKNYMNQMIMVAQKEKHVKTIKGRKRHLTDIDSQNPVVRGVAERNAINAPIQGSAADIIKIAMIRVFNRLETERLNTRMLLQVHDELVFEVPKDELDKAKKIIREEMENAVSLSVPLTVDVGEGANWLEAH